MMKTSKMGNKRKLIADHMGQFLQGGKNGCFMSLFFFTESLRVAKPCKIKLIFRLISEAIEK